MTRDTSENEPFAGERNPETVRQNALVHIQQSAMQAALIVCNPLSLVPDPWVPFLRFMFPLLLWPEPFRKE